MIVQQGALNTTALVVPDLYVQIVPPQNLVLNGVPTNRIGVVGSASWGPVNQPTVVGTMADYARQFGPVMNRTFDMGTHVATAVQQGASDFRCVRVTDGTDTAAVAVMNYIAPTAWQATTAYTVGVLKTNGGKIYRCATAGTSAGSGGPSGTTSGIVDGTCTWDYIATGANTNSLAFVALYSGTVGNSIRVTVSAGSKANSWKIVIGIPGLPPEVFDNITGATAPATYLAMMNAINNGNAIRGPSQLVMATGGGGGNSLAAVAVGSTYNGTDNTTGSGTLTGMSGGTDGASGVAASNLIGQDTVPRKGMYQLRGQGVTIGVLADLTDSTQWTTADAFGLAEGIYMIQCGPSGDTISNAVAAKATAGLDSYASKLMFGDWIYWNDQTNAVLRLVSPQGFVAGRLANLSPEQSSLNKPLYGVVGSQKSGQPGSGAAQIYSAAEITSLLQAGIDVIANPQPGGNYWGVRGGHNSSSDPTRQGDNYTRMTNFIAATLNAGMGRYVGQVINVDLYQRIRGTLLSFLSNLLSQRVLGSRDGKLPFAVVCDASNNPDARVGLGYVQADVQVQYQAINEKFIVNVEGGQTVQVTRQTVPSGQVGG